MDFPYWFPGAEKSPGGMGRTGTATGEKAIFAKGCFVSRGAGWSPKTEDRSRCLLDCSALLEFVLWFVNPQFVGSSQTRGAMKNSKPLAWSFSAKFALRRAKLAVPAKFASQAKLPFGQLKANLISLLRSNNFATK